MADLLDELDDGPALTHKRAMERADTTISPEATAKVRNATADLVSAFRQKHHLEPDDAGIDVRKIGDNVVIVVRKLSRAEREWRDQLAIKKNLTAATNCQEKRPSVFAYVADLSRTQRWLLWLKRTLSPAAVFLSEAGARREGGPHAQVYKLDVKA